MLDMASSFESGDSSPSSAIDGPPSSSLRAGAITVASLLVGGLAAVLWYRNTLNKLHQAEGNEKNTEFGISEEE
jgi:hypothetical protein